MQAAGDFENALTTKEIEAFTCDRCPSEDSPDNGLDVLRIVYGICGGMQVDLLVPKDIEAFEEKADSEEVQGTLTKGTDNCGKTQGKENVKGCI